MLASNKHANKIGPRAIAQATGRVLFLLCLFYQQKQLRHTPQKQMHSSLLCGSGLPQHEPLPQAPFQQGLQVLRLHILASFRHNSTFAAFPQTQLRFTICEGDGHGLTLIMGLVVGGVDIRFTSGAGIRTGSVTGCFSGWSFGALSGGGVGACWVGLGFETALFSPSGGVDTGSAGASTTPGNLARPQKLVLGGERG